MGKNLRGFTLLEMVITMVVATILLLTATSTFDTWQAKQRMNAALHALHQDLLTARSQAIMAGIQVVACPGLLVGGCTNTSNWSEGWLVFQDINGDRQRQPTEPLLRQSPARERINIQSSAHRRNFRFYPNGTAPGSNGSIWLCGTRGPGNAQKIVISSTGRIRREADTGLETEDCPE